MDQQILKGPKIADIDAFKEQVEIFVEHHRNQQKLPQNKSKVKNKALDELISESPNLTEKDVETFFSDSDTFQVSLEVIDEVHQTFQKIRDKVNNLPPKKRFFILETVNFFSSQISIAKLIPALLVLEGEDQKKAICEFILPTFLNVNKNIELLVAENKLFDPKTLHIERGILYTFVSDLAKILIGLFKEDFISGLGDINSPIEFFLTTFELGSYRIKKGIEADSEFIYQEMVDDPALIRKITLEFTTMIQTHASLYNYAIKRHIYYKSFLYGLTKENRFADIEPIEVSRILAGCLVANKQISPDDDLIEAMIDEDEFQEKSTLLAKKSFFDKLAPTTVYDLIVRVRTSMQ